MTRLRYGQLLLAMAVSTVLLAACGEQGGETKAADINAEGVAAVVNGKPISTDDLMFFLKNKQEANPSEAINPPMVLNEMVNRELLLTEAENQGIDKRDDVKKMLEIQRTSLLVNMLLEDKVKTIDTSDEILKKEYDEQVNGLDLTEYKARHILLETPEAAQEVIDALAKGADFEALAKEKSTGPTGPNGGDLGWFQSTSMVEEFGSAVKAMKKGDVSTAPVQTQFGYHVIKLEDTRKQDAPPFEETKDRLKSIVANKAIQQYLTDIREAGKVEIKAPAAEPVTDTAADTEATPATDAAPAASTETAPAAETAPAPAEPAK